MGDLRRAKTVAIGTLLALGLVVAGVGCGDLPEQGSAGASSMTTTPVVNAPAATRQSAFLDHGKGVEAFVRYAEIKDTVRPGTNLLGPPSYAELPSRPAISFPAGVSYQEAVLSYYAARQAGLDLPDGAMTVEPLPAGKVVSVREGRIVVDSAAPLGYDLDTGRVIPPTFTLPGNLDQHQIRELFDQQRQSGEPLPVGARFNADPLPRCQLILDGPDTPNCDQAGAVHSRVTP